MKLSLKAARVNANLAAGDAAERLGISRNTLMRYENGKSYPTVNTAQRMVELYGVTLDDIIFLPKGCA